MFERILYFVLSLFMAVVLIWAMPLQLAVIPGAAYPKMLFITYLGIDLWGLYLAGKMMRLALVIKKPRA